MKQKLHYIVTLLTLVTVFGFIEGLGGENVSAKTTIPDPPYSSQVTTLGDNFTVNSNSANNGNIMLAGHTEVQVMSQGENAMAKSMWNKTPIDIKKPFTINFQYYLNGAGPTKSGDGLTFTMQNENPYLLGHAGEAIGVYGALRNSSTYQPAYKQGLTVEFDPKYNDDASDSDLKMDSNAPKNHNHVAITDGSVTNVGDHFAIKHLAVLYDPSMVSNVWKQVEVHWEPNLADNTGTLTVSHTDTSHFAESGSLMPSTQTIAYTKSLSDFNSSKPMYWGFTAGTGDKTMTSAIALDKVDVKPVVNKTDPLVTKKIRNVTQGTDFSSSEVTANPGDTLEYQVSVDNSQAHGLKETWNGVNLTEKLPTGLTSPLDGGQNISLPAFDVPFGNSLVTKTYRVKVSSNATSGQTLKSETDLFGQNWPAKGSVVSASNNPEIKIQTKVQPSNPLIKEEVRDVTAKGAYTTDQISVVPGDELQYRITVDNSDGHGIQETWNNVNFRNNLPDGGWLTWNNQNGNPKLTAKGDLGAVPFGQTKSTTYKVNVAKDAAVGSSFASRLRVGGDNWPTNGKRLKSTNSPIVKVKAPISNPKVVESVRNETTGDGTFSQEGVKAKPGDVLEYQVSIDNNQETGIQDTWKMVQLTDQLPNWLENMGDGSHVAQAYVGDVPFGNTPVTKIYRVKVLENASDGQSFTSKAVVSGINWPKTGTVASTTSPKVTVDTTTPWWDITKGVLTIHKHAIADDELKDNAGQVTRESWPWDQERSTIRSVQIEPDVTAQTSLKNMFSDMPNLIDVYGLGNLQTSSVQNMSQMFKGDTKLNKLDYQTDKLINHFDSSKVTDYSSMFEGCQKLTNFDATKLNVSGNVDISRMFYDCANLLQLDLTDWNLVSAKETNMLTSTVDADQPLTGHDPIKSHLWKITLGSNARLNSDCGLAPAPDDQNPLPENSQFYSKDGTWTLVTTSDDYRPGTRIYTFSQIITLSSQYHFNPYVFVWTPILR
ncbi:BspA family leucine-rich repeat surface protein [Bombilactobacillus folatiphilus]|uniref:BspA family leucine-rich repeat surface protein n=1 Tax=Bombilactobacillus folatiphilus TaxID=2923362 RepID=A0ABY4P970_9LACO|nr:BspA family leucine-rich repeat surface protein [Bombilactobacillus folatiphilus]UQS82217.1 BspA family leucine-rich repeat surface protein [Bombilactobacillus folatiphilus]